MKKKIGNIIAAAGLAGLIYYTYEYFQQSDSFEVLGADVTVSTGNYVPIIVSAVVMLAGLVISRIR